MTLYIQNSLFLIPELHFLVWLSVSRVLIEIIPISEVHELPTNIHDILDNAASEFVGNALIFKYIFLILFAGRIVRSGLCGSPFFTILTVTSSEACLYGHINLTVVQAEQNYSLGLSQSSTS